MNTPPTMSTAPLPMAPVKSNCNKKQVNKLDIKPKKLLYNEQDVEIDSIQDKSLIYEGLVKNQAKTQFPPTSAGKELKDSKLFIKHVEQNELDNEVEKTVEIEHSYNLRRRNRKYILKNTTIVTKTKVIKKTLENDKENLGIDGNLLSLQNASNSGKELFTNQSSRSNSNIPNSLSQKDSSFRGSFTHLRI